MLSRVHVRLSISLSVALGLLWLLPHGAAFAQDDDDDDDDAIELGDPEPVKKPGGTPPPDTKPPSKTLERAVSLYKKKQDYYSASIELNKVISGESGDEPAKVQLAEYFMGKTLYQLGYYAAALGYFDRIVQQGTAHRYNAATLKWLAALARELPETSGILAKIGRYEAADLEQPVLADVRDELYYLLGRHYYKVGRDEDLSQALSLFQSVNRESAWFIHAKFFQAVTHVRRGEGPPATDALKEILVIGEEKPKAYTREDIEAYNDLANVTMARIFYTTKQFDTSIRYYEKLEQKSPQWLESLFEASWAYFMKTKYSKALGNIHTLNAPYFENQYFPESIILKAVMFYFYCQYDRSEEAVSEFEHKYGPLMVDLENILKKFEDNAEFYEYVTKILDRKAGLPPDTERLVLSVLNDKTVAKTLNWVDELGRELKKLEGAEKGWQTTKVASEVLTELELQKSLAQADAGKLTRGRIRDLYDELRAFNNNGVRILVEIDERRAGREMIKAQQGDLKKREREEPIVIDDEHFEWRFDGEYWKDELGFYRYRIKSVCPKDGAPVRPN